MRCKRAKIDSLALSSEYLETVFISHDNYRVQTVKSKAVFQPKEWSKTFGKSLKQNTTEAKIIHGYLGVKLPMKTFAVSPTSQTVEFAGLHGYTDQSELLVQTLQELKSLLEFGRIARVDVAIDYKGEVPKCIIRALSKHREPFQYKNTTYWKTPKEKKSNPYMDIKIYNKAKQLKLDDPLMRLEFVFRSKYFPGLLLKDMDKARKKMEKSIKRAIDLCVKIEAI